MIVPFKNGNNNVFGSFPTLSSRPNTCDWSQSSRISLFSHSVNGSSSDTLAIISSTDNTDCEVIVVVSRIIGDNGNTSLAEEFKFDNSSKFCHLTTTISNIISNNDRYRRCVCNNLYVCVRLLCVVCATTSKSYRRRGCLVNN
jgi:hypothetical protein